mgnify:FL=1
MNRILLACLLVATFQQPIGNSMQGFVMQHTVAWCEEFNLPIRIESQMRQGEDGPLIGEAKTDYYPVPKTKEDENPAPSPGANPPTWAP